MSGLGKLSETEKREMIEDANNEERRRAFRSARLSSQNGGLDEYVEFLAETLPLFDFHPAVKKTKKNKL